MLTDQVIDGAYSQYAVATDALWRHIENLPIRRDHPEDLAEFNRLNQQYRVLVDSFRREGVAR